MLHYGKCWNGKKKKKKAVCFLSSRLQSLVVCCSVTNGEMLPPGDNDALEFLTHTSVLSVSVLSWDYRN